jgi:chitosanase
MSLSQPFARLVSLATIIGLACAAIPTHIDGSSYNKPSAGPSKAWFAGATSLPASKIASAAAKATKVPSDATYILEAGKSPKATIHSDWAGFSKVCAIASNNIMPAV